MQSNEMKPYRSFAVMMRHLCGSHPSEEGRGSQPLFRIEEREREEKGGWGGGGGERGVRIRRHKVISDLSHGSFGSFAIPISGRIFREKTCAKRCTDFLLKPLGHERTKHALSLINLLELCSRLRGVGRLSLFFWLLSAVIPPLKPLASEHPRIPFFAELPPCCKPFTGHDRSGHEISWRMSPGDFMTLDMLTQLGGSGAREAPDDG